MAPVRWIFLASLLSACSVGPAPRPSISDSPARLDTQSRADFEQQSTEARALMQTRDYAAATKLLQQLTRQYPQRSGPWTNLGISLAHLGQRENAITALRRATQSQRSNAVAWNWLGQQLRREGDIRGAEQAYLSALQARPDDASTHRNLAILYDVNFDRPTAALEHYRRYQELTGGESLIVEAWARATQDRLKQTAMAEDLQ